jgi:hypothetical protein
MVLKKQVLRLVAYKIKLCAKFLNYVTNFFFFYILILIPILTIIKLKAYYETLWLLSGPSR